MVGLRAIYRALPWLGLSAGHQQTLLSQGSGLASRDVTLSSAGVEMSLQDRFRVGVEGGWGPEVGSLVMISAREDREDGGAVFAHTSFSLDHDAVMP